MLDDALNRALERVSATPQLLVALDFDGTLAPFTDDPSRSRSLPDSHLAIIQLWRLPDTTVALVSGRALESLRTVSDVPQGVLLAGSHGVELQLEPGARAESALSEDELREVASLGAMLDDLAAAVPGAWVEHKPAGSVLHTRTVRAEDEADELIQRARALVGERFPGVRVLPGSRVLEFSVRQATKGDALDRLRKHAQATAVVYIGDDVTDEDALRRLGGADVGVKVGHGDSAAEFRVPDPQAVSELLLDLAAIRRKSVTLRG